MPLAAPTAARLAELLAELDSAHREFVAWLRAQPAEWSRARPGKWTVGQHAEHVAKTYALFAESFEQAEHAARAGTLPPRPRRDPLQAAFVLLLTRKQVFPRGGRAAASSLPGATPDRAATLARLDREVARFRALAARMDGGTLVRIWAHNPFAAKWHYTFPEIVRVQAQHTRHHFTMAREAVA
jgi:hypothetical protein